LVELPICEGEGEIMPRQARIALAGVPVHIIQRGHNRSVCFFSDQDFVRYLDELAELSVRLSCAVHAYCLMTNHVHLLLTSQEADGCARLMKHLGQRYVQYVNRTHRRTGSLWEGRYRSSIVDSSNYLLRCQRYIELNPVRAGIVAGPDEYAWSSYGTNALGVPSKFLLPHPEYLALGATDEERRATYRALFEVAPSQNELTRIRESISGGFALGSDQFLAEVSRTLRRRAYRVGPH